MQKKTTEDIDAAIAKTQFTEYVRFEGDVHRRNHEKQDFMAGLDNAPDYDYPHLRKINVPDESGKDIEDYKEQVYEGLITLDHQRRAGTISETEYGLYRSYFNMQLKKMMLVEVASRMRHSSSDSKVQQLAIKEDFMILNRDLYGEMDSEFFSAILHGEEQRVEKFQPCNEKAARIKRSLMSYFLLHRFNGSEDVVSRKLLKNLHRLIRERYGHILAVVPNTGDGIIYDANASRKIMHAALEAGGLAEKGWRIEIDTDKSNPSTAAWKKRISLPSNTARTASQLRRLIMHEQEVHARRAQNGDESGLALLRCGTAEYSSAEEGLGVLLECAVDGSFDCESYHRVRDRYITAGLALGLDGKSKDSRATFSLLWRLIALRIAEDGIVREKSVRTAKQMAMSQIENAFRGTNFLMPGVIYMKLKIYYEGLMENGRYFSRNQDDLEHALEYALVGKYNHVDVEKKKTITNFLNNKHDVKNANAAAPYISAVS